MGIHKTPLKRHSLKVTRYRLIIINKAIKHNSKLLLLQISSTTIMTINDKISGYEHTA